MMKRHVKKLFLLVSAGIVIAGLLAFSRFAFSSLQTPSQVSSPTQAKGPTVAPKDQTMPAIVPTIAAQRPSKPTPTATSVAPPTGYRLFTVVNKMQETIWVAAASDSIPTTGWVLPAGASVTITIPDAWNGRIWGRTGCSFNRSGFGQCETGDCGGKFQCGKSWGAVPATLAEINLNSYAGLDFYDVSLVDGANLPMYINTYGGDKPDAMSANGCVAAGCTKNLLNTCPTVLQLKDASGHEIACDAACNIFHTDQYCCRGAYITRSMCDPTKWPVNYAKIFKAAEPFAYSYPDDDATSVFTCKPECNYRITFGVSS